MEVAEFVMAALESYCSIQRLVSEPGFAGVK